MPQEGFEPAIPANARPQILRHKLAFKLTFRFNTLLIVPQLNKGRLPVTLNTAASFLFLFTEPHIIITRQLFFTTREFT